ncbi:fibronectin type III domain-containing protein [Nonomuraea sp. NPDC003214]
MGFVRKAVYTTQTPSSSHTFNFGNVAFGNRIVLIVNSYAGVSNVSGNFELVRNSLNTIGIRLYSKKSFGDSSVTVSLTDSSDRIFMWMFELSNADVFYGADTGVTSGSAFWSESGLSDGCVAILGIAQYVPPGVNTADRSWPSGFEDQGVTWRNWENNTKQVWSSTSVNPFVSGSLSVSHDMATGNSLDYAWAGGVWGPTLDTEPPTVPGNLRLTGMTPTSVTVAWDAASDDVSGIAGYGVYKNGEKQGGDQTGRTKTFTGLTSGIPYVFEVDAVDGEGNRSARSAPLTITPIDDTTPPLTPVVKVTALGEGSISVAWDQPYDETTVVGYGIYLNGQKQGADQAGRTRSWTGLTPGGLYTIGVDAKDLLGNRSQIGTKTVRAEPDTAPPTVPGAVRVVSVSQTSATIAWDPSSDDNVGLAGYGVYLGSRLLATVTSHVFTFTQLTPKITYPFGVDAVDELGNRTPVQVVHATTLEDTSGAAPPYEYVFYDWETHLPIDSLPLQSPSMEVTLGGTGQLTAEIPMYDPDYAVGRVEAATRTERTIVVAFRGERPVWMGRVVDPQDYDSETGVEQLTAEEVIGIFARRFVRFTGPREDTRADTEFEWLLDQASEPADRRWMRMSGVTGSSLVDREYREEDFSRVLDTASSIASAPGGFDWWGRPDWDNVNDRPQVDVRRVNRDTPPVSDLVLEYPGNVRRYRRSTRRGLATVVNGKLSLPTGGVLLARAVSEDLHVKGWPRTEDAYTFDGLTSQAALQAETDRAAATSRGSKQVFEFTLNISPDVRWWEWELGSMARVVITDRRYPAKPDGRPGLDRPMKIISRRVEPAATGGEQVTVTTAELTANVDEEGEG